jgi:WD40 repeat protein
VFKARDRGRDRLVALKLIRKSLLADPEVVGRFYREMEILNQLDHPNIVRGYEAGPAGPAHFLAMEFVEGTDLGKLVKRGGPMPVHQACAYVRQVASGLQHAHERGLVHRDVKPHNLIMSLRDGLVKVADLGLARLPRSVTEQVTELSPRVTTGTLTPENAGLMGTADYLAPEQAMDFHAADIRADIYSLGCTLFFLLTGQPPFAGGNLAQKVARHMHAEPPAIETLRTDLPTGLPVVLRKMLAKRPEDRYQTPAEVEQALAAVEGSARHVTSSARKPYRVALAIGGLMLLGLLLWLGLRGKEGPVAPKKVDEFAVKKQDFLHVVAFSVNGKLAVSGGGDASITVWDATPGKQGERKLFGMAGHKSGISHLAFSPDSRFLASGSVGDKTWKLWDVRSQRELAGGQVDPRSQFHSTRPFIGPFTAESQRVAICHGEGTISLLDMTGKETSKWQHKELPTALAFSPDGRSFAVAAVGRLMVYDVGSGKELVSMPLGYYVWALAFSPDNTWLAAARGNYEVHLMEAATLKRRWMDTVTPPRSLPSRTPVVLLTFAPDGKTVACGGWDHQVKLWDTFNGVERATLPACENYTKPICGLGISPDSKMLFIGGEDDAVKIWRLR